MKLKQSVPDLVDIVDFAIKSHLFWTEADFVAIIQIVPQFNFPLAFCVVSN